MVAATISLSDSCDRIWDAIVVGAGPAGSVAAIGLARSGLRVLLVDRATFPRHKLCGACLNRPALSRLEDLGLGKPLQALGGMKLTEFHLQHHRHSLNLALPSGLAVTRSALDAMLVDEAITSGADFLPGVNARLEDVASDSYRQLKVSGKETGTLKSHVIVLATGLANEVDATDGALDVTSKIGARIGVGTSTTSFPQDYHAGTIFMGVGRQGYVGLTRTEGDSLNLAAALDRGAVRSSSPAAVCRKILEESGFPITEEMLAGSWRGTTGLTRKRRIPASTRVFVIGDAAGYVEPFTGEGMSWAICGGQAVVPFAQRVVTAWEDGLVRDWTRASNSLVGRRQRWCRMFARLLRHPVAVSGLIRVVGCLPSIGYAVVRRLNQESRHDGLHSGSGHSRAA